MYRISSAKPLTLSVLAALCGAACSQVQDAGPSNPAGTSPASRPRSASGHYVSGSYGGHNYDLYVPGGYNQGTPAPLVLMLHGCTQNPASFEATSGMSAIAEANTFFALYPDEPSSANASKCWNWFLPVDQARGSGEPALFAGLIASIESSYSVDQQRVYAAGFSAGAGMAAVLGVTYPDLYAAVLVNSGLEYQAATTLIGGLTAMSSGGPNPVTQGKLGYQAEGSRARVMPVLVVHGTADHTVIPLNGNQALSQYATTNDWADDGQSNGTITDKPASTTQGQVPGGHAYTHYTYNDGAGRVIMEKYVVTGMDHRWPGPGSGTFADNQGPPGSQIAWSFFQRYTLGGIVSQPDGGAGQPDLATGQPDLSGGGHDLSVGHPDLATGQPDLAGGGGSASFPSIGAEDGYAGQFLVDGYGTSVLKAGDRGFFNVDSYRMILSFDTSSLPAGAVVKGARLVLTRSGQTGTVSSLSLDIRSGAFGSSAALEQGDYGAAASASGVASAASGATVEFTLPASALQYINHGGRTQLRVRAATTPSFGANVFDAAGSSAGAQAPLLRVDY